MKICFIIPFYYKWNTFANVRANYEELRKHYSVDIFTKKQSIDINLNNYDLIMLHGSGSTLTKSQWMECTKPIFGFGWSDPNIFNMLHLQQSLIYFTNDLNLSRTLISHKPVFYYQTACDKRYHVNLNLEKTTDILTYGCGNHKFVTNRNEIVNDLRKQGFKIKVFGRGWDKHEDTFGFIEGQRLIEEINKAHLVLDLSNQTTSWAHRIFEASACGTPVITIDREDTRQMFEANTEIILYSDISSLMMSLDSVLCYEHILKEIGEKAQARCYKDHDISVRIKELEKIIEEIK